jgi:hypothetical protein
MKEIINNFNCCIEGRCEDCTMNSNDCEMKLASLMLGAVRILEVKVKRLEDENKELRDKLKVKVKRCCKGCK